jgi:hypothetical protein
LTLIDECHVYIHFELALVLVFTSKPTLVSLFTLYFLFILQPELSKNRLKMDEMEEGEISDNEDCTTDAIDAPYKPLARPSFGIARPLPTTNDFEELEETAGR